MVFSTEAIDVLLLVMTREGRSYSRRTLEKEKLILAELVREETSRRW